MSLSFKTSSILVAVLGLGLGSCMGQFSGSQGGSGSKKAAASSTLSPDAHRSLEDIMKDILQATAGSCDADDDCDVVYYKPSPCLKYQEAFPYAKANKDNDDIERIDSLFNEYDKVYHATVNAGLYSNCAEILPDPKEAEAFCELSKKKCSYR